MPDKIAYQDDIAHIADMLEDSGDPKALDYVAQFLGGLARSAQDGLLETAAKALAEKRAQGGSATSETATIAGMIQSRLSQREAI